MTATWDTYLSHTRLRSSQSMKTGDEGNDFLSDYQRVVFSSAFRRLQDKTQVNPLAATDFVRRRLTHSVEVATVGERMGRVVAVLLKDRLGVEPWDRVGKVVATACLLHDIGNPPFGHEGELAIRDWAEGLPNTVDLPDYRGFDGNAQGFRIVVRLHNHGMPFGANLTSATLASMVKYPLPSADQPDERGKWRKYGFMRTEKYHHDRVRANCGLKEGQRHPLSYVMEAADDIANRLVDLEDGLKLRYVEFDEVRDALGSVGELGLELRDSLDRRLQEIRDAHLSRREKEQFAYQHFRAEATARFSQSCERAFVDNIDKIEAGAFSGDLISVSDCSAVYSKLKDVEDNIFLNPVARLRWVAFSECCMRRSSSRRASSHE